MKGLCNKYLLLIVFTTYIHGLVVGQARYFDERYIYTQASINPQMINPGAIGEQMNHRILLNYRNKWSGIDGAPSTISLIYDGAVGNNLAVGVNLLSDRFGQLETTKGAFGVSYTIKSEVNQVAFGISAEYIKHALSGFGNSNPNDPTLGLALAGNEFFDASFGLYGIYLDKLKYGLAIPSAISSRINATDEVNANRTVGLILQAGYELELHEDIKMTPYVIMKRMARVPTHLELNLNFSFLKDKLISGVNYTLGADKRLGFLIGTNIEKFQLYYTYNTSSHLVQDYNNGSHEITVGLKFGGK